MRHEAAPPAKTEAFWDIVNASCSPEDAEIADLLDSLGNPDAVTLARLHTNANDDLGLWLKDRKNRRMIPHRLDSCDYPPERNKTVKDGLWKIGGTRQVVYAKKSLSAAERLTAIRRLTGD